MNNEQSRWARFGRGWVAAWPFLRDAGVFTVAAFGLLHYGLQSHPSPEVLVFWGGLLAAPGVVAGVHLGRVGSPTQTPGTPSQSSPLPVPSSPPSP